MSKSKKKGHKEYADAKVMFKKRKEERLKNQQQQPITKSKESKTND